MIKQKKPAIIKEGGVPRFVVLDWETYGAWQEWLEDIEDTTRLVGALADPRNQKRIPFARAKRTLRIP